MDFTREYPVHIAERGKQHLLAFRGFIAPSQVVQELPFDDQMAWRKEMLAPETEFERGERLAREAMAPAFGILPGSNPILVEIAHKEPK